MQTPATPPHEVKPYFGQRRVEMLPFIPATARRVIDVGCGSGAFASQLLGEQREVWGIEPANEAASIAATRLDRVICATAEEALKELPLHHFDCIVFNDVLEHLVDPFAFLASIRSRLSATGVVVASIPNVRYFYNLRELLVDRQWKYRNYGILDRTHLRFFTALSMVDMFENAGYRVRQQVGINSYTSWKFKLLEWCTRGHVADMKYEQFACVAEPISPASSDRSSSAP